MGKSVEDANGTIRFSFGVQNTIDEIEYTLEILDRIRNKMKK
jgi:cysteine sulfinate desulfinase/cysteine desulfurase-like protein